MAKGKLKTVWYCGDCGNEQPKFFGKCPACGAWNTAKEEVVSQGDSRAKGGGSIAPRVPPAQPSTEVERPVGMDPLPAASGELNRVLGGGFYPSMIMLVGGDPGIGKTTLLVMELMAAARAGYKVMYASAEESRYQLKETKVERLGGSHPNFYIYDSNDICDVINQAEELDVRLLVVDSTQTMRHPTIDSLPGYPSQVRAVSEEARRYAKRSGTTVIMISQVTKDGTIAGPNALDHDVDAVFMFERDDMNDLRILRAVKNRQASTDQVGFFEMNDEGLMDVPDISERFVTQRDEPVSGSAVSALIDGSRAWLLEVQSLVTASAFGLPRRTPMGVELNRLHLLLAVIEKRVRTRDGGKLELSKTDVVVKVIGGLRVTDPAIDLALAAAIVSSGRDLPLPPKTLLLGEVSPSGEIGRVTRLERRLEEAARLGYTRAVVPRGRYKLRRDTELIQVQDLQEALGALGLLIDRRTAKQAR